MQPQDPFNPNPQPQNPGGSVPPQPQPSPYAPQPQQPAAPSNPWQQPAPAQHHDPFQPAQPQPAPQPPTPAAPPTQPNHFGSQPAPTSSWQQPTDSFSMPPEAPKKKKKKLVMIIVIVVAVLALVAAGWWAYNKWFKGIELETYNNENYTLLVPVGYNKEEDNDFQEFKEPGDEDTQSEVMAYYAAFPEPITADQVSQFKDLLKSELEDAAKNNLANPNDKVEDLKITDVKYKGEDALQLTATVTRDGKKEGEVKLVAVINTNEIYMVGVGAHVSDPGVSKEMDNIINSFEKK